MVLSKDILLPNYQYRAWSAFPCCPGCPPALTGFVMSEQLKSLDFRARHMKQIESAPTKLPGAVFDLRDAAIS